MFSCVCECVRLGENWRNFVSTNKKTEEKSHETMRKFRGKLKKKSKFEKLEKKLKKSKKLKKLKNQRNWVIRRNPLEILKFENGAKSAEKTPPKNMNFSCEPEE